MVAPDIRVVPQGSGAATADAAPGSVLARLRQQAAAQRVEKTLELSVGGSFGENLVIRYGMLPVDELERYMELAGKMGALTNLAVAIDMAVSSCRTFLWREDGTETDLNVRIGSPLWTLLDWPLPDGIDDANELTPREVMLALFGGNSVMLAAHLGRLETWMQDPEVKPPGEASAATS